MPVTTFEISRDELALQADVHGGIHVIDRERLNRLSSLGLVYWDKRGDRAQLTPLGKSWLHDALRPRRYS
jgi:hypothetical protein